MSILLIGLLISTDVSKSLALFRIDGKALGYRVGYEVPCLGKIEALKHHKLFLSKNGKTFSMRPGDSFSELEEGTLEAGLDDWPQPFFESPD